MFAYCNNNSVNCTDSAGTRPTWNEDNLGNGVVRYNDGGYGKLSDTPIDVTYMLNKAMTEHAAMLEEYYHAHNFIKAAYLFYIKVNYGGEWDLKTRDDWFLNEQFTYLYNGIELRYDDVGNIHYGYVGSTLFGDNILLVAAGGAQVVARNSSFDFFFSNFDDPRDQWAIRLGCFLWDTEETK